MPTAPPTLVPQACPRLPFPEYEQHTDNPLSTGTAIPRAAGVTVFLLSQERVIEGPARARCEE